MSTTANVFRLAARELEAEDRIHVIDSENLSTGIGHLVVEAAVMAGKGMSAADIEKNILELRPRVRASFVVDTLTSVSYTHLDVYKRQLVTLSRLLLLLLAVAVAAVLIWLRLVVRTLPVLMSLLLKYLIQFLHRLDNWGLTICKNVI